MWAPDVKQPGSDAWALGNVPRAPRDAIPGASS